MRKKKIKIAICYDFDGTLSPGNMQEHSLLPSLNQNPKKFWKEVKEFSQKNNMNEILAYMYLTLKKADEKNHPIKKNSFKSHGKGIKLFDGVEQFFDNITHYAKSKNLIVEHYIISSGLKEIIEGTKIRNKFEYIFASEFFYDVNKIARWPASAIDYTNKTQYLFRINKGIINVWDNTKINKFVPQEDRYIPFSRIIYIGDGETDIPCMKMVNHQGGFSIAVYDPKKRHSRNKKSPKDICLELIAHGRAKYIAPANYKKNGQLYKILKAIIDLIHNNEELNKTVPQKLVKKIKINGGCKEANN